ncbi:MAG: hypothetical protein GXP09_05915 [Gammaproteobacteria bacterium]|nr:hypothetical protein [Gammaproteobacteria bacterium]
MMATRIYDMPVYAIRTDEIDAPLYNLWRRAYLHLQLPTRIQLPDLKQMALILEEDSWVVVDQCQYDLPVLAWIDFQDNDRTALHTPVTCQLNYYHHMANHLREKVLILMGTALRSRLDHSAANADESKQDKNKS